MTATRKYVNRVTGAVARHRSLPDTRPAGQSSFPAGLSGGERALAAGPLFRCRP